MNAEQVKEENDEPEVLTFDLLQEAISGSAAAFRCRRRLQPAGGEGDKVFPPTFSGATYSIEQRHVSSQNQPVTCVLLDSVQSQANRMEMAIQEAIDAGRFSIPLLVVDFTPFEPTGNIEEDEKAECLIDAIGKVTSLQVPHRLADAILRDSQIDGVDFRKSTIGKALNSISPNNATALFELCPTALIFGMWDSTGPKGGLGPKFERAIVSEVVGVGAQFHDSYRARGVRRDPLEIRAAVKVQKMADKSWEVADEKGGGVTAPSAVNHSSVPFDSPNSGVTIEYAEQITTLSLVCLRRLHFPLEDFSQVEVDVAARTLLAALGLCSATLAFEAGIGLRSRCLLWPDGEMLWEFLDRPGMKPKVFSLNGDQAIHLLVRSIEVAKKVNLPWREDVIQLQPSPELLKLVRLSQLEAIKEEASGS